MMGEGGVDALALRVESGVPSAAIAVGCPWHTVLHRNVSELLLYRTAPPQVNAKISKTTHLKEMNVEIEKLKQMLICTREKNGEWAEGLWGSRGRWGSKGCLGGLCSRWPITGSENAAPRRLATHQPRRCHARMHRLLAGVYVPAQQYEDECAERRQLGARVDELEAEAEAVGAQHELYRREWQGEMEGQRRAHEAAIGQVGGVGGPPGGESCMAEAGSPLQR